MSPVKHVNTSSLLTSAAHAVCPPPQEDMELDEECQFVSPRRKKNRSASASANIGGASSPLSKPVSKVSSPSYFHPSNLFVGNIPDWVEQKHMIKTFQR